MNGARVSVSAMVALVLTVLPLPTPTGTVPQVDEAAGQVVSLSGHPRLWIRVSDLPRLRSWAVASNPIYGQGLEPVASIARADMDTGRVPGQDSGSDDYEQYATEKYAALFAFMSLIAPDQATRDDYGGRARTLLMHVIDRAAQGPAAGQPFRDPCWATCDSNRSRWHGEAFALTVDWAYPYLSGADKAQIRTVFTRWAREIVTSSYHIPQPAGVYNDPALVADPIARRWAGNNYFTAHMRNLGLMAMALDDADDPGGTLRAYLRDATGAWLYMFDFLTRNDSRGGLLPEGYEYSPQTLGYVAQLLLALQTAGQDNAGKWGPQVSAAGNPFWDDSVLMFLHSLSPATAVHPDAGTVYQPAWYGSGQNYFSPDFIDVFGPLALHDANSGNTGRLSSLRWILVNTGPGGAGGLLSRARDDNDFRHAILYFLVLDPAASAGSDPRAGLPLSAFAPGLGRILARTGWDAGASWFTYKLSWNSIDHQNADGNQIEFYRRGEWLTKERTGYDLNAGASIDHNTISIQNTQPARPPSDYRSTLWQLGSQWTYNPSGDPRIVARRFAPDFVYVTGDATNLYNSTYENTVDVAHASRSVVWLKPDHVVIYDRAASHTSGRFKRFALNLPTQATVSGNRATMTTASGQRLVVTSLLPAGAMITSAAAEALVGDPATGEPMRFRLQVEAPREQQSTRFLHVLQGVDGSAPESPASLVQSSSGVPYAGAAVAGTLVLFPVQLDQALTETAYVAPIGTSRQIITGLTPGARYDLVSQPAAGGLQITIRQGTTYQADEGGVLDLPLGPGGTPPPAFTPAPSPTGGTPTATATLGLPGPFPTATATTIPSGTYGGRGFAIQVAGSSAILTWQSGSVSTPYVLARLSSSGLRTIPQGTTISPSATSSTDPATDAGLNCYALLPVGPSGILGISDIVCGIPGTASPGGGPRQFTLRLNQSSVAELTWSPPLEGPPDSYLVLDLSGASTTVASGAASTTAELSGPMCFAVLSIRSGSPTGNTPILCGVPGAARLTLAAPAGSAGRA